jgi:hypothetical protein
MMRLNCIVDGCEYVAEPDPPSDTALGAMLAAHIAAVHPAFARGLASSVLAIGIRNLPAAAIVGVSSSIAGGGSVMIAEADLERLQTEAQTGKNLGSIAAAVERLTSAVEFMVGEMKTRSA